MSRAHDDAGTVNPATPHELVRELENSIAARLAAANQAGDEVALAQVQADHLIAEAEAQAAEVARHRTAAILVRRPRRGRPADPSRHPPRRRSDRGRRPAP